MHGVSCVKPSDARLPFSAYCAGEYFPMEGWKLILCELSVQSFSVYSWNVLTSVSYTWTLTFSFMYFIWILIWKLIPKTNRPLLKFMKFYFVGRDVIYLYLYGRIRFCNMSYVPFPAFVMWRGVWINVEMASDVFLCLVRYRNVNVD